MTGHYVNKKILGSFGLLILFYLIYKIGINDIVKVLISIDLRRFILSLFVLIPFFLISTYKLKFILDKKNFNIDFAYLLKLFFIGNFYSTITPAHAGGVLMRIFYLKEKSRPLEECSSAVFLDKITEVMVLLLIGIFSFFVFFKYLSLKLLLFTFILLIILIFVMLIIIRREWGRFFLGFLYRFLIPEKTKEKAKLSFNSFYSNLPSKHTLFVIFLLAVIGWFSLYSFIFFLSLTLSIKVDFIILISSLAIGTLVGFMPFTIGGLGTREATHIFLLGLAGVNAQHALTLSLLSFMVVKLVPAIFGGLLTLTVKK